MASLDDHMDLSDDEKVDTSKGIEHQDVVTKYTTAAEIANKAVDLVVSKLVPGVLVVEVCTAADLFVEESVGKIYNKGKIEKGLAFPTCININHIVSHFSPYVGDNTTFSAGDLVKIDLGVHIDGYIAVVAHTAIVGNTAISGRKADVLAAAYTASECALRMLKPGNKNSQVTEMFAAVASTFGCNVVQAVLSHQMKRFVIDGNKTIISKSDVDHKVEEFEFEVNDVFALDVVMTTGEGKPKEVDERVTVFKRAVDKTYQLKLKAARQFLSDVETRYPMFPFSSRSVDVRAKLGIKECLAHDLVIPYPVLQEKDGECVAQFKFTALITANGTLRITSGPIVDKSLINTQFQIVDPSIKALMAEAEEAAAALAAKKEKKNKKKATQPVAMEN